MKEIKIKLINGSQMKATLYNDSCLIIKPDSVVVNGILVENVKSIKIKEIK